ncbi:MAG: aldo/keto reductase [Candidatus Tectomicrobia bacterium]|uniref:Aldo/keto reductase n=1 Tax=Tectimicrobiota bacterium TaxID=2528274 RepID=A0A932HZA4_UNCTE|nr:aldo/keto reductase [Candidatus Tectomicrobia bacterium]
MTPGMDGELGRREFLKRSAMAGLGAGLLGLAPSIGEAAPAAPRVRSYRPLGKTGLEISDISFGSSRLGQGEERVVLHALERGINYFDTAESYTGGASETTIGNALRGKRDKVYLTSKVYVSGGETVRSFMSSLEGSLRRLRTDHVDVYFHHAVNDVDRLKKPEWHEFTDLAKKQGKIRFTGASGHAGRLIECMDYVIDSGRFDIILVSYNFGQDPAFYQKFTRGFDFISRHPDLPRIVQKAKSKGVGVVAMKTLMGARLNDMRPYERGGATFSQAAFRWVLSNPGVDALIISMTDRERVDEFLGASGWKTAARQDLPLLYRYAKLNGASYCRHACNDCAGACPVGVPIADVLRTRMYAVDYGDLRLARSEYALLGAGASACLTCAHQACAGSCTYGLPVQTLLRPTHRMLAGRRELAV